LSEQLQLKLLQQGLHLFVAGNFLSSTRQETTVTTAMQDIQMPGPMKTLPELVWMAVMIRGVCREVMEQVVGLWVSQS